MNLAIDFLSRRPPACVIRREQGPCNSLGHLENVNQLYMIVRIAIAYFSLDAGSVEGHPLHVTMLPAQSCPGDPILGAE